MVKDGISKLASQPGQLGQFNWHNPDYASSNGMLSPEAAQAGRSHIKYVPCLCGGMCQLGMMTWSRFWIAWESVGCLEYVSCILWHILASCNYTSTEQCSNIDFVCV
ncbi:hypothetical protein KC19_4G219100 [Ceratodon purpureus]|uniref:Uncharacterized protein n=1 Tax=Ceratodon purpureus TaxID=3225 RepID=A0A8T0IDU5_CERPU|nr:hypothetical protein KC19_4G219100 [Ceratodon purpureus]